MTDIKSDPFYQEICALMEAKKEKEIDKWKTTRLKQTKKDYSNVSDILLSRYETALDQYANTLKRAYSSYQGTPGPAQRERLLRKLVTTDHRNLSDVVKSLNSARTQNKGKTSKKNGSGWWGHALGCGSLILALTGVTGLLIKGDKNKTQSAPSETDKLPGRIENRINTPVARQGQTFTAMATQESGSRSLLGRLQSAVDQSMEHPSYVTDDAVFDAQVKALQRRNIISGLDVQGSANQAAIAAKMASTAASKRDINYSEQRMKVDTMESWEDVSRSVERTMGNLRGTIQQATGSVNAARDFGRAFRSGRK